MHVHVLIFGPTAHAANADRLVVNVPPNPTVRDVLAALHTQHPTLKSAFPPVDTGRLAVNHTFASGSHPIKPGLPSNGADEVALITLVGGG